MELYVHVPFCVRKCAYCDFLSFPADAATQRRYVDALLTEIEHTARARRSASAPGSTQSPENHPVDCARRSATAPDPAQSPENQLVDRARRSAPALCPAQSPENQSATRSKPARHQLADARCVSAGLGHVLDNGFPGDCAGPGAGAERWRGSTAVTSIYIGGGTPSILPGAWIAEIMESLRHSFTVAEDAEISIEVNPGTLDAEKLAFYRAAGINRISFGLQSTDDAELEIIGRIHTYSEFEESFRLARAAGFSNINVDLMFGLPGQSLVSWEKSLRTVAALNPEHISAYSLILEEGIPLQQLLNGDSASAACSPPVHSAPHSPRKNRCRARVQDRSRHSEHLRADVEQAWAESQTGFLGTCVGQSAQAGSGPQGLSLPDEDEEREMFERTADILAEYGFTQYEISNYAKPGCACRHNNGYWTGEEYLGLGLGASSYLDYTRFRNTTDLATYLRDSANPQRLRREVQALAKRDREAEFMILGLRLTEGVSEEDFAMRFGEDLQAVYGEIINKYQDLGLLVREPAGRVRLTRRGLSLSNIVMAELL